MDDQLQLRPVREDDLTTSPSGALEKAGFTGEGISRGIGWRDGEWRDGVIYSLLRTDLIS
jgi:L-amino acid N-acyltransferase YncA